MTFKEALFFTGKCLTINHEKHNKLLVEEALKKDIIDWDMIVKVSTAHYVFPALYCNLKKANFLEYLPEDLVAYMKHITDLNRDRNSQIIEQAKEINNLLLENNITPIFLKGTGNLLEGLYDDIAERMVGDIDFLVSLDEFEKTVELLKGFGYSEFHKKKFDSTIVNRHFPKMTKKNQIASIEVHYKMVSREKFNEFNYQFIKNNITLKNNYSLLSHNDKVIMTSINKQLNDLSDKFYHFGLRNSYDLFLLSIKTNTLEAIKKTQHYNKLNPFLYSSFHLLGKSKSIRFIDNKYASSFFAKQITQLESPNSLKKEYIKKRVQFSHRLSVISKAFYNKEYRKYLIARIKSNL